MLALAATGFAAGLALIVAIGSQNAFVLRQGLLRRHVVPVVVLCTLSDVALIAAGVLGVGTLVSQAPAVLTALRWAGVAFLLGYAVLAGRRAWRGGESLRVERGTGRDFAGVLLTAGALTWLNPHVYLDTVLLLGTLANQHGAGGRWVFAAGAALGSAVWFAGLGLGARGAAPLFARPSSWRVLDALVAAVMVLVAVRLATT
ncbi:LysE/ArgO family amino acid transporter [Nocardioides acrostichi]|uniref:Amino acid transporter n=1 Tax=Nocardioides acrostichi TaxID=2784339 RepID=A0A930YC95_9ACTN|nr:LysE/ArgO family amino acid transporter [Nocardioides acrostichi]MBF4161259.1 amino acid transporter [Nocardioides acrostichi]